MHTPSTTRCPATRSRPVPYRAPREGLHPWTAGHTDPHSQLGTTALIGVLAAKAAMEKYHLQGTLKFFGEPAEKVCGSKPVHAAKGYYDGFDAFIAYHPNINNSTVWETHCGSYWSAVFTFECLTPEEWIDRDLLAEAGRLARDRALPRRDRRALSDVHEYEVHQGGDVPAYRHLDPQ